MDGEWIIADTIEPIWCSITLQGPSRHQRCTRRSGAYGGTCVAVARTACTPSTTPKTRSHCRGAPLETPVFPQPSGNNKTFELMAMITQVSPVAR